MTVWAVVGLGNPGTQYSLNRHNIGFMVLDVLQNIKSAIPFKVKGNMALTDFEYKSEHNSESDRIILIKPQTYMNLSGRGVSPVLSFYKIPLENVIVFHDDLDLDPGVIRIKKGGGHGGHNGLKSLDGTIGKDYWRVRLGIGHPGHKDAVSGYVLSNFRPNEIDQWVLPCVSACAESIVDFFNHKDPQKWLARIKDLS